MSAPTAEPSPGDDTAGLGRLFILIVLVEIVTIAGLYWFGAHFS